VWLAGCGGCDNLLVRKAEVTPDLVSRLIGAQFPRWAGLPVRPVDEDGWDNATLRLGEEMSVRLPSAQEYVPALQKEQRWLPTLAGQLPLPIPDPLAAGVPGCGFPWPWSIYRWTDGAPVTEQTVPDLPQLAADLAGFLAALYRVDPAGGPPPGPHNFFRGGPLAVYDGETLRHDDCLDVSVRPEQPRLQGTAAGGPGDPDPGTRLGDLESHEGSCRRARQRPAGCRVHPGAWRTEETRPPLGIRSSQGAEPEVQLSYRVDDIAAAVERVRTAGGHAGEPERRPYGLHAECVDDQGATFRLWQPAD
jgi:Phosphotransferase enzyme family